MRIIPDSGASKKLAGFFNGNFVKIGESRPWKTHCSRQLWCYLNNGLCALVSVTRLLRFQKVLAESRAAWVRMSVSYKESFFSAGTMS
jgi:hypothetical protein